MAENRILAACEIGMHSFMERPVNIGRLMLVTNGCDPQGLQRPVARVAFPREPLLCVEMGIDDRRCLSLYPQCVPSGYQLTSTCCGSQERRVGLFIWVTLWTHDAIPTSEKKCPPCICLKWASVRTQDWSLCLEQRLCSAQSDENESSARAFPVLTCERRRNVDGALWPREVDFLE